MRIIAGQFKGRRLLGPHGRQTRPITDRVKASLFGILARDVPEAVVVDLFCGTGSIGLEALSRGARLCCFAERDRAALARLRRNVRAMGLERRCRIWGGDLLRVLPRRLEELSQPIDLAFVDPPYEMVRQWRWEAAEGRIFAPLAGKLAGDGRVVLRCPRNIPVPEELGQLSVRERRDYGKMSLVFFEPQEH
ncbi:MAG: 16S rRNA (guanine(966)-N(2))-methyltransferase RsmD [Planctomycetales bacterium 4484_123]|nr:MAG: 16S rRNA (guanine(966)-N(2))-methyltransferase RsmD [Planctomycetales bacterium 4484_123]